jgi:hypothetical protein
MINVSVKIDAEFIVSTIGVLAEEIPGYGTTVDLLSENFEGWVDWGTGVDLLEDNFESWTGFLLNVTINPPEGGSVTKNPSKSSYNWNEPVILTAFANIGYVFLKWMGDLTGSVNPSTIRMNANKNIIAVFGTPG